jgi:poly(3-hydroxybutyrate) depolymerase
MGGLAWRFTPGLFAHHGAAGVRDLETKNAIGRSGKYYVPELPPGSPVPLLVYLHGTGGKGQDGIDSFQKLADERHFAVLAPESGAAPDGSFTWEVGTNPGEVTEDRRHVMASLAEMTAREGLSLDTTHVVVVGHSGGASSAPYLATNEEPFTAFAVLHGGVFPTGFGARRVRGWFSTGSADGLRPPSAVTKGYEATKGLEPSVEMHVFDGGHVLGEEERRAVIDWWLAAP